MSVMVPVVPPLPHRKWLRRTGARLVAEFYPYSSQRLMSAAKRDAARAVAHAVRTKALIRQRCAVCGKKKAEAHHDDYNRPLEVAWLCRHHHRERDAELRQARRVALAECNDDALPMAYLRAQAQLQPVPFAAPQMAGKSQRRRSWVAQGCTIALVQQATQTIADALDEEGLSDAALSRRLKVSRHMVGTQFAGGFRTLKVLAAYAAALGYEPVFVLRRVGPGAPIPAPVVSPALPGSPLPVQLSVVEGQQQ